MIAEIILNSEAKDLNRIFDYKVPENMINKAKIGSLVLVPFGRRKVLEEGFIIGLKEQSSYETKEIAQIEEALAEEQIKIARWMSKRYFCNLSDCIKLMMPPGSMKKKIQNRAKEKTANFVDLAKEIEEIEWDIQSKKITSAKQIRILNFLTNNGETNITDLSILTDTSKAIIKTLQKNNYVVIQEKQIQRNPFKGHNIREKTQKLPLTQEQQHAYQEIEEAIEDNMHAEYLLFGVTGSRKDRSLYAVNRESIVRRKIKYFVSTRNLINSTNGR